MVKARVKPICYTHNTHLLTPPPKKKKKKKKEKSRIVRYVPLYKLIKALQHDSSSPSRDAQAPAAMRFCSASAGLCSSGKPGSGCVKKLKKYWQVGNLRLVTDEKRAVS